MSKLNDEVDAHLVKARDGLQGLISASSGDSTGLNGVLDEVTAAHNALVGKDKSAPSAGGVTTAARGSSWT